MKHASIAIMTANGESLGQYSVDPARHSGGYGDWSGSSRLLRIVKQWLERRRQRRTLKQLDERMLKDIGLSQIDAEREIDKPFWRP